MGDPPLPVMSRPSLILPPGTILGGYEVEEVLGIGGMAVVYRAVQRSLGRPVALKVLNPRLAADETFRARFRREGAMVAALDHPSVVPVHDLGEADGRLFLAMRLIEGVTLADRLDDGGLSADELRPVLRAVANALDAAHAAGVLHRDVKPQNVLLADDGTAYLADFGVARVATSELTRTREFFGSVSYVAPEQIRGESLGPAADIYGLAVMTYECLTGAVPFRRDTDAGIIHAHLELPPPPIGTIDDPAATALSRAVAIGLEKQPEDRPTTAGGLVDAVELALAGLTHDVRSRRPAFAASSAPAADLPLAGIGGDHPPRGGTQPIAVAPPGPAPVSEPEPTPAKAPRAAKAPAVAARRRRERSRRRLPYVVLAALTALLIAVAALLIGRPGPTAEADVPRLAASGAPERVTRAARDARERALAAERAAEREAAAKRAAARRKAARRKAAASASSSASTPSSGSSGATTQTTRPPTSSGTSSSGSTAGSGGSSTSGGSSSSRAPSSSVCDFPPC